MYRNLVACALALGLAGCSVGISGDGSSPHTEFKAAVNYKDAYDAAIRQANACLRSTDNAYRVVPSLDEASRSGEVRVLAPFADTEMTRVNVKAAGDKSTDVRIVVWGKGTWDVEALRAMKDAVSYNLVSCSSFMPRDPQPQTPRRRNSRAGPAQSPPGRRRMILKVAVARATSSPFLSRTSPSQKAIDAPRRRQRASITRSPVPGDRKVVFMSMVAMPTAASAEPRAAALSVKSSTLISVPPCTSPRLLVRSRRQGSEVRA